MLVVWFHSLTRQRQKKRCRFSFVFKPTNFSHSLLPTYSAERKEKKKAVICFSASKQIGLLAGRMNEMTARFCWLILQKSFISFHFISTNSFISSEIHQQLSFEWNEKAAVIQKINYPAFQPQAALFLFFLNAVSLRKNEWKDYFRLQISELGIVQKSKLKQEWMKEWRGWVETHEMK